MKRMTQKRLNTILLAHWRWVTSQASGKQQQANLSDRQDLYELDFSGRDLSGAEFSRADLSRANFSRADISHADFRGANLEGANLEGVVARNTNFCGASLVRAKLRHSFMVEARFREARMTSVEAIGANLEQAVFDQLVDVRGANFREANLIDTWWRGANLQYVSMARANLRNAGMGGANLTGADLEGASLQDADLEGAILTGADLSGVNTDCCERLLSATSGTGYTMVMVNHSDHVTIHAGCRNFTLEEAENHWDKANSLAHDPQHLKHARAALRYLKAAARSRGWRVQ